MNSETYNPSKIIYILIGLASFIIIVAGFRAAAPIIVPFMMALFFSLIIFPVLHWAHKKAIPLWLSIFMINLFIIIIFSFLILVLGSNIKSLAENIPYYHDLLEIRWESALKYWSEKGIDISVFKMSELISSNVIKDIAIESISSITVVIEDSFLIFVLMIFMLFASFTFPAKVASLSSDKKGTLIVLDRITHLINHYMVTKTLISFVTGLMVTVVLLFMGIDHAIFWGFLAFALNYIPNIGSFLAAIPVVFLVLIQLGFEHVLYVILAYVLINVVMGNIIEPRAMGKSTELSVIIIFLSLIFWGWILGPVGMFLSVPLTIVLKIVFEHFESTRWLSILLGPDEFPIGKQNTITLKKGKSKN